MQIIFAERWYHQEKKVYAETVVIRETLAKLFAEYSVDLGPGIKTGQWRAAFAKACRNLPALSVDELTNLGTLAKMVASTEDSDRDAELVSWSPTWDRDRAAFAKAQGYRYEIPA